MGLPHLLVWAAGYRWLPLADENRRSSRRLRLWWYGHSRCRAVSPQGVVERRELAAGVDARLGLITCVRR